MIWGRPRNYDPHKDDGHTQNDRAKEPLSAGMKDLLRLHKAQLASESEEGRGILKRNFHWKQEQVSLEKAIAEAQAEEIRLLEERRLAGAALLEQVMAENAVIIEQKKLEKAREVQEDQRILAYLREQDAKALVIPQLLSQYQHIQPCHLHSHSGHALSVSC